jgi:hypothetical protein
MLVLKRGTKVSTAQVGFPQYAREGTIVRFQPNVTSLPGDVWYIVRHGKNVGGCYHESWISVTDNRPDRYTEL